MKVLSTEQQQDLLKLLEEINKEPFLPVTLESAVTYWAIELKPKRVRKKTDKELAGFSAKHII